MGVHRRVDIYSIESAGIEYSIDMKVNLHESQSSGNPSVVNSKTSLSVQVSGPNPWQTNFPIHLLLCGHLLVDYSAGAGNNYLKR